MVDIANIMEVESQQEKENEKNSTPQTQPLSFHMVSDKVLNAKDACEKFEIDAAELDSHWAKAKASGNLVKFGGGFY